MDGVSRYDAAMPHEPRHSGRIESCAQAAGNGGNTHNLFGLSLKQNIRSEWLVLDNTLHV